MAIEHPIAAVYSWCLTQCVRIPTRGHTYLRVSDDGAQIHSKAHQRTDALSNRPNRRLPLTTFAEHGAVAEMNNCLKHRSITLERTNILCQVRHVHERFSTHRVILFAHTAQN